MRVTGWIVLILIVGASIAWFGFFKPEPPPISDEDRIELSIMDPVIICCWSAQVLK